VTLGSSSASPGSTALAQQGPDCVTVTITLIGVSVSPTVLLGTVTGDIKGAFLSTFTEQTPRPDGSLAYRSESVTLDESGDYLRTNDQGILVPVGQGVFRLASSQSTVVSGTGKYAGITGTIRGLHAELDLVTGLNTGRFRGQLCRGR
jgi:hypothetical protein